VVHFTAVLAAVLAARRLILVVLILVERVVLEVKTFTLRAGVVLVDVLAPARRGRNL
jgi:hypothetical protein